METSIKEIEHAAGDYAYRAVECFNCKRRELEQPYTSLGRCGMYDMHKKSFMAGVDWHKKAVLGKLWHDRHDTPERNAAILVETGRNDMRYSLDNSEHSDWEGFCFVWNVKRWLYVDDLAMKWRAEK